MTPAAIIIGIVCTVAGALLLFMLPTGRHRTLCTTIGGTLLLLGIASLGAGLGLAGGGS